MKVLLLKDVVNMGQKGDVKTVSSGHARNFLFPQKLAEQATDSKIKIAEEEQEKREKQEKEKESALFEKITNLKESSVLLHSEANEKGGLFASVKEEDVSKALKDQHGVDVPARFIQMEEHIKHTGKHTASVLIGEKKQDIIVEVKNSKE